MDRDNCLNDICRYLKCGDKDAINGIKNLHKNLEDTLQYNKKIESEIARYQVKEMIDLGEKIGDISLIKKHMKMKM